MMRIVQTLCLLMMVAALFVGCGATPGGDGGGGEGDGGGGVDIGQMMLDNMKKSAVSYQFALPAGAAVGNTWEMTIGTGDTAMVQKYAIVAEMDGKLIVEMAQDYSGTTLISALAVDPNVDMSAVAAEGEQLPANVTGAWIGKVDSAPEERPVMEAPVMPAAADGGEPVDAPETGEESLELAGKTWNAMWTMIGEDKMYMEKGSNFMLQMSSMNLSAWSNEGAASQLNWDGDADSGEGDTDSGEGDTDSGEGDTDGGGSE